jgi:hypothetical protein
MAAYVCTATHHCRNRRSLASVNRRRKATDYIIRHYFVELDLDWGGLQAILAAAAEEILPCSKVRGTYWTPIERGHLDERHMHWSGGNHPTRTTEGSLTLDTGRLPSNRNQL